ncbi:MAG: carboxypeptidase regulatory-like domain-containing protein [Bryobacteraceae bacterium]
MKRAAFGLVLSLCSAQPQSLTGPERTVEGVVTDKSSGLPLAGVTVSAPGTDRQAVTDDAGRYTLRGLKPANYVIAVPAANSYPNTWRRVSLRNSLSARVDFQLAKECVIAGRVIDAEGRPVHRAVVTLRSSFSDGNKVTLMTIRDSTTDERGHYEFRGLKRGRYFVKAIPASLRVERLEPDPSGKAATGDAVYASVRTFYPNSVTASGATGIRLDVGQHAEALDIKLRSEPTVCVTSSALAGEKQHISVVLYDIEPVHSAAIVGGSVSPGERFRICGISAGRYRLSASTLQEGFSETEFTAGAHPVDLPPIAFSKPVRITGRVFVEGGKPLPSMGIVSLFDPQRISFAGESHDAQLDESSSQFSLSAMPAKTYRLDVSRLPPAYYVKTATLDSADALAGPVSVVSGKPSLEIVLGTDGGQIAGVAKERNGGPVADALIVLARKPAPQSSPEMFWMTRADQNGEFVFTGRAPGGYFLLAFPSATLEEDISLETAGKQLRHATPVEFSGGRAGVWTIVVAPIAEP